MMTNFETFIKKQEVETRKAMKAKKLETICRKVEPLLDAIINELDGIQTEESKDLAIEFCRVKYHLSEYTKKGIENDINYIFEQLREIFCQDCENDEGEIYTLDSYDWDIEADMSNDKFEELFGHIIKPSDFNG